MPSKSATKEMNTPKISLHSFILGFSLGCVVIYILYNSVCVSDNCYYIVRDELYVQVEPIPNAYESQQDNTKVYDFESDHNSQPRHSKSRPSKTEIVEDKESIVETENVYASQSHKPSSTCPKRPVHLVILVLSSPHGHLRRYAIRGTWLHDYHRGNIKVTSRFLIGTYGLDKQRIANLTKENNQFGDILLLNTLKDSYQNLSTKVLQGLQWAYQMENFDFLLKTDDDSYVRIGPIVENIRTMNCDPQLYWGYFMGHAYPEPSGKWAENNWFNCPHYLPYAMGGGYIVSGNIIRKLMRFSNRLKVYSNEDVTVGSWLSPFNLNRKHDLRFNVESLSHGCNNNHLIAHKERVRSLYEKYTQLVRNGSLCLEEKEVRPGYVYNWTTSPLDCCNRTKDLAVPSLI